ncbi:MAG: phage/plasmid primase, P4 family [Nanoarchaeota archaeon]
MSPFYDVEQLKKIPILKLARDLDYNLKNGMNKCPFHEDNDPSLSISEEKNLFKCFGCQKQGTVIEFAQELLHLEFKEVCKFLSDEYNPDATQKTKSKKYPGETTALEYLAKRERNQATEEIVNAFTSTNHVYSIRSDTQDEVWIYDSETGTYKPNGITRIKEFCRDQLGQAFNNTIANDVIQKIIVDHYIEPEEFFKDKHKEEIVVNNGILNIHTRKLSPHTPHKRFFQKIPVTYDENAKCDKILDFLKEVYPSKEDRNVIIEATGSCLQREYLIQKALVLVGNGGEGKSAVLSLILSLLGEQNVSQVSLQDLNNKPFAKSILFGKLANICADIPDSDLISSGGFKELTGGDWITADRKYMNHLRFKNHAKLLFSCNQIPQTKDISDGFFRRLVVINHTQKFLPQKEIDALPKEEQSTVHLANPEILKEITTAEELSGLLNLALEGLNRLNEQRDYSYTPTMADVKKAWLRKSNSFLAFCEDNIREDYDSHVIKAILKHEYVEYCRIHKLRVVTDKQIKDTLETLFGAYESRHREFEQKPVWEGIKLEMCRVSEVCRVCRGFSESLGNAIFYTTSKTPAHPAQVAQNGENSHVSMKKEQFLDTNSQEHTRLVFDYWGKCGVSMCTGSPCALDTNGKPFCEKHQELMGVSNI